jgi:rhodanese-related sulfurtransferase
LTGLEEKAEIFTTDGPIATVCPSGSRSTTAASILKWKGADEIAVSLDGLKAWKAFDYPLEKD